MLIVDVLVVGGGMVGAACALGMARQGKSVALVEALEIKPFAVEQPMDLRISAISKASIRLLKQLDVWQQVLAMRACPYDTLVTWEKEENYLQFDAKSLGLSELGYMVENRILQLSLWQTLQKMQNVTLFFPHHLLSIEQKKDSVYAHMNNDKTITAKLVIAADGANSWVRKQINIGTTAWDYRHHCMLIHVKTKTPQSSVTWQQFTPQGPLAFLPFVNHNACLVWYADPVYISKLKTMTLLQLQKEILHVFPKRLGEIEVISVDSFSLTRRHAHHYYQGNIVLAGDAAHSINPLAGQGVNLGFKDLATLLTLFEQVDWDENIEALLSQYERKRKNDNLLMQSAMDVFYKGFSNDITPIRFLRNVALKAVQRNELIKKQILKYAVGFYG